MRATSYSAFSSDLRNKGIVYAAERAKALGFESVEFIDYPSANRPWLYDAFNADELHEELERQGVAVGCYSLGVRLQNGEPDEVLAHVFREIEFAAKLHTPFFHHTVTMDCTPTEKDPTYREMLKKVLPLTVAIANKCAEHGIVCLYEPQGLYFNGVRGLTKFFKIMKKNCPNVAICGDLGNSLDVDENPVKVIRKLAKYVAHVHIKDCKYDVDEKEYKVSYKSKKGKNIHECEIGKGDIDLAACFKYLRKAGYNGRVSFEVSGTDEQLRDAIGYTKNLWGN